jgi:hypothetical protein
MQMLGSLSPTSKGKIAPDAIKEIAALAQGSQRRALASSQQNCQLLALLGLAVIALLGVILTHGAK